MLETIASDSDGKFNRALSELATLNNDSYQRSFHVRIEAIAAGFISQDETIEEWGRRMDVLNLSTSAANAVRKRSNSSIRALELQSHYSQSKALQRNN